MNKSDPNGHNWLGDAINSVISAIKNAFSSSGGGSSRSHNVSSTYSNTVSGNYTQIALPGVGGPPIPPSAIPGTPENKKRTNQTLNLLGTLFGNRAFKDSDDNIVEIYRAVSADEYLDIQISGQFRPGPNSLSVKQFGNILDETISFAINPFNKDAVAVVGVTISRSDLDRIADRTPVDPNIFRGGTISIPNENLIDFNRSILRIRDVY